MIHQLISIWCKHILGHIYYSQSVFFHSEKLSPLSTSVHFEWVTSSIFILCTKSDIWPPCRNTILTATYTVWGSSNLSHQCISYTQVAEQIQHWQVMYYRKYNWSHKNHVPYLYTSKNNPSFLIFKLYSKFLLKSPFLVIDLYRLEDGTYFKIQKTNYLISNLYSKYVFHPNLFKSHTAFN